MIASTPVGSWTWETKRPSHDGDLAKKCVEDTLAVLQVLKTTSLVVDPTSADATVRVGGGGSDADVRSLSIGPTRADAEQHLLSVLHPVMTTDVGVITIDLSLPGAWLEGPVQFRAEKMFTLSVDVWASSASTVVLRTYSDVWMTHDLCGNRHSDLQRQNAPLLAAALLQISQLLGAETDPGEPTWYGTPTVNGFEDIPDEDPEVLDSWGMFEVPSRSKRLHSSLPSGVLLYGDEPEGAIQYVEVGEGATVLGYVWASESGASAGYEPRSAAGDAAFVAGRFWLMRLSDLKKRRFSALQALGELERLAGDLSSGSVIPGSRRRMDTLELLQQVSGKS
ncbi:hypothetical protein ABT010_31365 [Streptomyces sp. NPDC002668]|uniref:hypothetical protein n=1 Tax=Streptomyces sp. NPDC002668 TaxID=3154422 RepID=UPI00332702F9